MSHSNQFNAPCLGAFAPVHYKSLTLRCLPVAITLTLKEKRVREWKSMILRSPLSLSKERNSASCLLPRTSISHHRPGEEPQRHESSRSFNDQEFGFARLIGSGSRMTAWDGFGNSRAVSSFETGRWKEKPRKPVGRGQPAPSRSICSFSGRGSRLTSRTRSSMRALAFPNWPGGSRQRQSNFARARGHHRSPNSNRNRQ